MALVKKGDLLTVLGWQRLFPMVPSATELKLAIAWGLALAIRLEEVLELLPQIESDLGEGHSPENAALPVNAQRYAHLRSLWGTTAKVRSLLPKIASVGRTIHGPRMSLRTLSASGYLKAGDLAKFYATPWIPYSLDEDRRNLFASVYRRCLQGIGGGPADPLYRGGTLLPRRHCISGTIRGSELGRRGPSAQPPCPDSL